MLKEQVAEELYLQKGHGKLLWHELPDAQKKVWCYKAVPIINLFKAEVDKLTVIDDEDNKPYNGEALIIRKGDRLKGTLPTREDIFNSGKEFQLQHTKKQFLDLMEGQSSDQ